MPSTPEELERALQVFRKDIVEAFANIQIEIEALTSAVVEGKPVSRDRLSKLRAKAEKRLGTFRNHYAQMISPAHELR